MVNSCCHTKRNCQVIWHLEMVALSSQCLFPLFPSSLNYCCGSHGQPSRQEALFANEGKQEEEEACPRCHSAPKSLRKPWSPLALLEGPSTHVTGRRLVILHVVTLLMGKSAFLSPGLLPPRTRIGTSECPRSKESLAWPMPALAPQLSLCPGQC